MESSTRPVQLLFGQSDRHVDAIIAPYDCDCDRIAGLAFGDNLLDIGALADGLSVDGDDQIPGKLTVAEAL